MMKKQIETKNVNNEGYKKYILAVINAIFVNKNSDECICNFGTHVNLDNSLTTQFSTIALTLSSECNCIDLYDENLSCDDIKYAISVRACSFITEFLNKEISLKSIFESDIIYTTPYQHSCLNTMKIDTIIPIDDDIFEEFKKITNIKTINDVTTVNNENIGETSKIVRLNMNDITNTNISRQNVILSRELATLLSMYRISKESHKCKCGGKCKDKKEDNSKNDLTLVTIINSATLPNGNTKSVMYCKSTEDDLQYPSFMFNIPCKITEDLDMSKLINVMIDTLEKPNCNVNSDDEFILSAMIQEILNNIDSVSITTKNLSSTSNMTSIDISVKVSDYDEIQSFLDEIESTKYVIVEQTNTEESDK